MHRFADDVLAQHGSQCCASVAIARERRPARALELDVAPHAVAAHSLTEQNGATITELVARSRQTDDRRRPKRSDRHHRAFDCPKTSRAFAFEHGWIEVELVSQAGVENDEPWILAGAGATRA